MVGEDCRSKKAKVLSRCGWNIRVKGGVENKIFVTLDNLNSLLVGYDTTLGNTATNIFRNEFASETRHGRKGRKIAGMIDRGEGLELRQGNHILQASRQASLRVGPFGFYPLPWRHTLLIL